jgi:predicted metal-dependent hydrolase
MTMTKTKTKTKTTTTTNTKTTSEGTGAAPRTVPERATRLSRASLRTIEPETDLPWESLGDGRVVADELLSTHGVDVDLSDEQRSWLSRAELASMLTTGVRFESGLIAGFAAQLTEADATDPRVTYMLHEMGEETRHSRAFARLIAELDASVDNPLEHGVPRRLRRRVLRITAKQPALLTVFVLAGEEIPDLMQKLAAEHPDTDPLVVAVNRYHRQEEARHLAFARMTLAEHWEHASWLERRRIRSFAPRAINALFASLVHPGVYRAVGLPPFRTWRAVQRSTERVALRHEGTRPVLQALLDAGVLERGRIPRGWRTLCGVDRDGEPVA